MLDLYWPLALGLILIAGFGAWVFIHSNRSYLLRWAVIPAALIVAVVSAKLYDARLGYAVAADLPDKFVYLAHSVVIEQNHKSGIEVWARTSATRLYRIPYSRTAEQAMDQAREQSQGGQPVVMQKRPKPDGSEGSGESQVRPEQAFESRVILPADVNPKT
jgi:hypothetical protein